MLKNRRTPNAVRTLIRLMIALSNRFTDRFTKKADDDGGKHKTDNFNRGLQDMQYFKRVILSILFIPVNFWVVVQKR
jgi:hypothetical protein